MIQDEGLRGEILREAKRGRELLRVDEDIVSQAKGGQLRDPALEFPA